MKGFALALAAVLPSSCLAVLSGDEQHANVDGGRFWAFTSAGISIINPNTNCQVERDITVADQQTEERLPQSWYEGVYMERPPNVGNEKAAGFVVINSGVTRFRHDKMEPGEGTGEILVFSTSPQDASQPLRARINVGAGNVHAYAVHWRNQFWTHSDTDGYFYVVDLDGLLGEDAGARPIDYKLEQTCNHGQLLWDQDHHSGIGYATCTNEPTLTVIDMVQKSVIGTVDYASYVEDCRGTNSIAYSKQNQHLYLECFARQGGTIELDVSKNAHQPVFVKQHVEVIGKLRETPGGEFVVATDKQGNALYMFDPDSGADASDYFKVEVPGHPEAAAYWPIDAPTETSKSSVGERKDNIQYDYIDGDSAYVACMPLTENTNQNHLDGEGNLVCDIYNDCAQAASSADVAHGKCLYEEGNLKQLQTVHRSDLEALQQGQIHPNGVCDYCRDPVNYLDDLCVCTPYCGSCAFDNYDARRTGVACLDLQDVLAGKASQANLILDAGAVHQSKSTSYGAQCGFGPTYRPHTRGGKFHASIAHVPSNSIQIVDMSTHELHCYADLPGEPSRVVYVPPQDETESVPPLDWEGTLQKFDDKQQYAGGSSASTIDAQYRGSSTGGSQHYNNNNKMNGGSIAALVLGIAMALFGSGALVLANMKQRAMERQQEIQTKLDHSAPTFSDVTLDSAEASGDNDGRNEGHMII